ncbi:MAG: hypothetical protein AB7C96_04885 [Hydrogenovibrio sp.]
MKFDVPEIRHSPFVTVDRFCEMTGLKKSQVRHLIKSGFLPVIRFSNGKQITKSHFVNLLKIQDSILNSSEEILEIS